MTAPIKTHVDQIVDAAETVERGGEVAIESLEPVMLRPVHEESTGGAGAGSSVEPSDAEREAAHAAYRTSVASGRPLTGLELGARFGRSERWGRARIAEERPPQAPPARRSRRSRAGTRRHGTGGTGRVAVEPAVGWVDPSNPGSGAVESAGTTSGAGRVVAGTANHAPVPVRQSVPQSVPADRSEVGRPVGARLVAWAGFLFGTVISVAANVIYAWLPAWAGTAPAPGFASQIGAAVWPIALVISVEVLSRVPWRPGVGWQLARYGGAGVVAVGAAVISYGHLHGVLAAWDYGTTGAAVGPLVIDGLMTISGFALLAMSERGNGTAVA